MILQELFFKVILEDSVIYLDLDLFIQKEVHSFTAYRNFLLDGAYRFTVRYCARIAIRRIT